MNERRARTWFACTALVVLVGVVVQVAVAANVTAGFFHTPAERALNVFCFFTILSNLIVGATSLLLALNPERPSTAFRVARLTGVVAIAITGVVYHSVLRGLLDLDTWGLVADHALHTVAPVLGVVGWLAFGPRGATSSRVARLSLLFPLCWLAFTLIRGEIVGFYPYHFVDAATLGYARVVVNCLWIAALWLALAAGAGALDRRWTISPQEPTSAPVPVR